MQPNIGLSSLLRPRQHSIGYMGDGFYRLKDPTNSIKVLKEQIVHRQIKHTISRHEHKTQQVPYSTIGLWGDQGTAPTEGRVARPERRWGYRRGTPMQPKSIPRIGNAYEGPGHYSPLDSPLSWMT